MKRLILMICMLGFMPLCAQTNKSNEKIDFNRHWYMQLQGGAAYTVGETSFKNLISPAAAISLGYQFSPVLGIRFGVSGWEAKGAWRKPYQSYKFNFAQLNADLTVDLANWFGGFKYNRTLNPYVLLGFGGNVAFNNGQAREMNEAGYLMGNLWTGHKYFAVGRGGIGVNARLSDHVLLGVEVNSNMYSDKYNSKKASNVDWQINALAGLTIRFGKNYKKSKAAPVAVPSQASQPAQSQQEPAAQPVREQPAQETPQPAELRRDIFFTIGSSEVSLANQNKVDEIAKYLKDNPSAKVEITGYADAATGTHAINARVSEARAKSVAKALENSGIDPSRIKVDYKGDTEQPFSNVNDNRVSICVAK